MSNDAPTSCKTILAGTIAKGLLSEVQAGLSKLDRQPHLLGILGNDDPAAKVYANWTQKTCKEK
jgi:methylenetetrahydrofolate dehydrogenase (NAD+)